MGVCVCVFVILFSCQLYVDMWSRTKHEGRGRGRMLSCWEYVTNGVCAQVGALHSQLQIVVIVVATEAHT